MIVARANTIIAAWDRFWFEPADPLMLGLLRILTGWMLFYNLLVWGLDLQAFFGRGGLQPLQAVANLYRDQPVFSFWLWIDDAYLWSAHLCCLLIAAMFCAGVASRVTSVLAFLITISYSQRVPIANFGLDQILGLLCLYLAISPCGGALSVDALIRRWWQGDAGTTRLVPVRKYRSARLGMRLIQLHLCAIYFWAGFAKLKGPSWWTGEALWRVLANAEYQTVDLTWMATVPWLPFLLAHLTILWEVFFIVLVWNPRLRPLVLAVGTGMHLGIGAFLGMWTFGLIMTFAYLSFADPDVWRHRLNHFSRSCLNHTTAVLDLSASAIATASLLVVAGVEADRFALMKYLRSHQFLCRVADLSKDVAELPLSSHPDLIVIIGSGMESAALSKVCHDFRERVGVPVLVVLSKGREDFALALTRRTGIHTTPLSASLREIRHAITALLIASPTASQARKV